MRRQAQKRKLTPARTRHSRFRSKAGVGRCILQFRHWFVPEQIFVLKHEWLCDGLPDQLLQFVSAHNLRVCVCE